MKDTLRSLAREYPTTITWLAIVVALQIVTILLEVFT